ncbi:hypothetical protein MJO28_015640 [Puccinia striiformis f. sp. tritici]|uniref:Uncharacterized protein n=1 Tax=Puccinia striiformis f. sp. tritici TaxID=168172 RepID=A0ACC0DR86_9BASI|nr:hypothetical protein MJO28_015640 [Puccinia striiformis f. sp. tritici]
MDRIIVGTQRRSRSPDQGVFKRESHILSGPILGVYYVKPLGGMHPPSAKVTPGMHGISSLETCMITGISQERSRPFFSLIK